jgi:hypothetical protein
MAESTVRVMFLGDAAGLSAATKKGEAASARSVGPRNSLGR